MSHQIVCGAEDAEGPVRLSCTLNWPHPGKKHKDDTRNMEWPDDD